MYTSVHPLYEQDINKYREVASEAEQTCLRVNSVKVLTVFWHATAGHTMHQHLDPVLIKDPKLDERATLPMLRRLKQTFASRHCCFKSFSVLYVPCVDYVSHVANGFLQRVHPPLLQQLSHYLIGHLQPIHAVIPFAHCAESAVRN